MPPTTTIRIARSTHDALKRLAHDQHSTVADTVARAVRLLRQEQMGQDLAQPVDPSEADWLDAPLG